VEIAYNYQARTPKGKLLTGLIYAQNRPLGFSKLKRNGFSPISLEVSIPGTIKGLISTDFDQAELARFYHTLGRRMKNGKAMIEGLTAASEYVNDQRLKQAILVMKQATSDGQNEFQAMTSAGFPHRDAMVIRATSSAGNTGDSFIALAHEISRVHELRKSVNQIFRMPIIMLFMMYAFFYGSLVWVAPMTMGFLKNLNMKLKLSAFNQGYFDFATVFNANILWASFLYFLVPVGAIYAVKSEWFGKALDKFKRLRDISVKSDQAALWNSFSMLYDAAIPVKEACRILADAAKRPDSRSNFRKLGRLVESGRAIEDAIQVSGFPSFVVSGVRASDSGGNLVEGLRDMVKNLEEDVFSMTEILKENVKILALLIVASGVTLIFFVTYYPIISSVLSAL
jgi:type II secretory pathway component PulF